MDDLTGEGHIAWLRQRPNYDARRGASEETYLRWVVRHAFADVLKWERAQARDAGRATSSLDEPLDGAPELTLLDIIPATDDFQDVAFNMDVRKLTEGLSPRQRAVMQRRRQGQTMSEIAGDLGVHRDTLYQDLQQIQRVFRAAGLFNPTDLPPASHKASGGSS